MVSVIVELHWFFMPALSVLTDFCPHTPWVPLVPKHTVVAKRMANRMAKRMATGEAVS